MRRYEWNKPGHCRRCNNGLTHYAGWRQATGVILQRGPYYADEYAPGEKKMLHGVVRARERVTTRQQIQEEL